LFYTVLVGVKDVEDGQTDECHDEKERDAYDQTPDNPVSSACHYSPKDKQLVFSTP
jgi:hypothetical protein